MSQESSSQSPTLDQLHVRLQAISGELRRPHRLGPAAQAALADLVDELDNALRLGAIANGEAARLATSAVHFSDVVHSEGESGVLKTARARLEEAVVVADIKSPMVAGLARRFMDTLANVGI